MKILSTFQVRAAEQDAVSNGIFSYKDLMENAAEAMFCYLKENFKLSGLKFLIVCGKGNNGGDGLVLALKLKSFGAFVSVCFPMGKPSSNPASEFVSLAKELNVIDDIPEKCDILIDALFGIGFDRLQDDFTKEIIDKMNNCKAKKISVDVPSGVNADGKFCDNPFYADITLTFIALKPCFVLPKTSEFCGKVFVLDIGVYTKEYAYLTTEKPQRVKRLKNSHKGTYGTTLHITGSYGMCGASVLASMSALVSGVGIVKNFVCDKNYAAFCTSVPQAVTIPVDTTFTGCPDIYDKQLLKEISNADSLLIGCGLGINDDSKRLVKRTLEITKIPTVIDADGINCIVGNIELLRKIDAPVIITPHPKEMSRLCGISVNEIEENRAECAKRFSVKTNCIVVLKGANTVIASPDGRVFFNMTGNPGMATGGSGDVLAGMISAHLAMGENPLDAALGSVYLHGLAGDNGIKRMNMEALLPTDIITELKTI